MSTSLQYLKELWTRVPLRLSCLKIPFASKWFQDREMDEFQKAVRAKHPATTIDEIHAYFRVGDDKRVFYILPSQLSCFRGLKTFSMTLPDDNRNPTLREILDSIDCPHLERVILRGIEMLRSDDCPGENLPNLRIFEVQPPFSLSNDNFNRFLRNEEVVEDTWEFFKRLMAKGIDFRYGHSYQPLLIDFVCSSGRPDSNFVLQWLIQCEYRSRLHDHQFSLESSFWLDLRDCNPRSRDRALDMLSLLNIAHKLCLWIKLCDRDTLSTVELLPKNISSLSIWIQGTFPLTLVPDVVRRLNGLSYLYLSGFPNGWSLQMSCFKDGLRFPSHVEIQGDGLMEVAARSFRFSLSEGWTVRCPSKRHNIVDVLPNLDFTDLETEMRWLCSLSPTLNKVSFYVTDKNN